jgi:hypothetical protein
MLRFTILPTAGAETNQQRKSEYNIRKIALEKCGELMPVFLYSPSAQRKRLAPAVMGSILVALLYGLIALAIFEGVTR